MLRTGLWGGNYKDFGTSGLCQSEIHKSTRRKCSYVPVQDEWWWWGGWYIIRIEEGSRCPMYFRQYSAELTISV